MRIYYSVLLILLLSNARILAQEIYSSNNINKKLDVTLCDSTTNLDSLNTINNETINHIKSIFANSPNKRPTIGFALAGGGAKGFAHVGVLRLIDSLEIPVDFIVGNSMGGLVAALYSIGYNGKELEEYTKSLDWNKILEDNPSREELPFIEKKRTGLYQLSVGLNGYAPTPPSGMIYGQNIQLEFLSKTAPYEDITDFDELPIPFRCIAVDLVTGKEEILKSGSLAKAMRATMSIPSAFSPVDWNNKLLVDGMILNNFPVDVVKGMGADIVIGLNLTTGTVEKGKLRNLFSVLNRAVDIPTGARLKQNINKTDIYISQDLEGYSTTDFAPNKVKEIINKGKQAGIRNLDVFLELKNELDKYEDYKRWKNIEKENNRKKILEKRIEFKTKPRVIQNLLISGNKKIDKNFIRSYLKVYAGDELNTKALHDKIETLYALNYFETVTYQIVKINESKVNLEIVVKEKPMNKIVAGFKYEDNLKLIGLIGLETNSALISGAQMEAYFRFGGLTKMDLTVLYPSRSMDIPLYPFVRIQYSDVPMYFYLDGQKLFSFNNRSWNFSGGLNFSLSKYWNLEAAMNYELMNVTTDIASNDIQELVSLNNPEAKIIAISGSLLFDSLDDIIVPSSGLYFKSFFDISMKDLGADIQFHRFASFAKYFIPLSDNNNLKLEMSYMYGSENTPFYKWYYIGGPESFVGIDYRQAHGTEFSIGQISYRYEFLTNIYLQGTFNLMFNYNLSNSTLPKRGKPIYGGGISLIMKNMFGKTELTFSRGDKDLYLPGEKTNRIYFTFGYNLR